MRIVAGCDCDHPKLGLSSDEETLESAMAHVATSRTKSIWIWKRVHFFNFYFFRHQENHLWVFGLLNLLFGPHGRLVSMLQSIGVVPIPVRRGEWPRFAERVAKTAGECVANWATAFSRSADFESLKKG